jgi:hypothetical protein
MLRARVIRSDGDCLLALETAPPRIVRVGALSVWRALLLFLRRLPSGPVRLEAVERIHVAHGRSNKGLTEHLLNCALSFFTVYGAHAPASA